MNASLAKQPFTDKTLSEMLAHCMKVAVVEPTDMKRFMDLKQTKAYSEAGSGEKLKLDLLEKLNLLEDKHQAIASDLEYLKFAVTVVHRMYIQRFFMNSSWKLTLDTIAAEESEIRDCLQFFEKWREDTAEYKRDDVSISSRSRERFFVSLQTYRNMNFAVCGFFEYARDVLNNHPSIKYVTSGHSNTSALESRFSIAKRGRLNDTSRYHLVAANMNSIATLKHKKEEEMSTAKKMKAGNMSYPSELIAPERPQAASEDFTVGKLIHRRKKIVDCCFDEWKKLGMEFDGEASTVLPTPTRRAPVSIACHFLQKKLQAQQVQEGTFVEMLREDETIRDLLVLTVDSPHWNTTQKLFTETGSMELEDECKYLVELAFEQLDAAVVAPKVSHKASFWWQIMSRMRDESVHTNSPNVDLSKHIRSYLFQLLSGKLMSWCTKLLQEEDKVVAKNPPTFLPGSSITYTEVGTDLNTYIGFSLFSVKKKYGVIDNLDEGHAAEDKFWLLTDLMATEEEIAMTKNTSLVSTTIRIMQS